MTAGQLEQWSTYLSQPLTHPLLIVQVAGQDGAHSDRCDNLREAWPRPPRARRRSAASPRAAPTTAAAASLARSRIAQDARLRA